MNEVLKQIGAYGVVPVVKIDNVEDALPLGKALIDGGLPLAEITFRTAAAEEAIRVMAKAYPEMLIGAGTVLTTEQVDKAVAAGAKFIVSPGLNPKIVSYCVSKNIPITPGCSNPSDIEAAIELGLDVVKFFPAEACGGLNAIKAMSAPYGGIKFMPTGGISEKNINEYLAFNKILACGGSWMVKDALIKEGKFDEITAMTKAAVQKVLGFELAHIGINTETEADALAVANLFSAAFGFAVKNGNSSVFAGTGVEANKNGGKGKNGHIAIRTNNIDRAMAYLERIGFEIDAESVKPGVAAYLKQEFGGFAVHLLQAK
ncbi:MAG: bifunctional 4-hydroxy-2-oxoglutarate aldolase/2-dehydro-3-deoxy-phosphogluconate aldolase [Oscillospiraceae bacterium]|nr:bifunctional 4-hydroxy-2-oxoglutarate aldolase/2-dehydro-3-deoxy-phosphogluconate aldolase [Oscillospiraceae bacterium]MBQ4316389.1 bifunctional 4-hydroxy-2-oxoglutarate aldolase/2-dehydro-3-deoxy-phosphogluconate aldolase [Oscillospiraceae bacterium]MBQ7054362.1 bifunctional 4-hydroxy-2-oxoglutarate aldolase/2-dehydro-3-deoxy-phosphogluconate aldolase [Oscillospiraceae bacterium]